jgi:hypothetical protein
MKNVPPFQQIPLDRVTQTIYARIHAAMAPACQKIAGTERNAGLLADVFENFKDSLPALELSAYNTMRKRLGALAATLGQAGKVVFSVPARAMAMQLVEHDLPRLAAIATKLNEEEAPKFFAALRTPDSAFGHFAIDAKKKTTIRKGDFDNAIDQIVNRRLAQMAKLIKQDTAEWLAEQGVTGDGVSFDESGGGPRYAVRNSGGIWKIIFDGKAAEWKDAKGLHYVAYLLKNPPADPIHGTELAKRACGHLVIEGQRNLAADDAETVKAMRKSKRECEVVLEDANASEVERTEARDEMTKIEEWARKNLRGTEGNEQRQVRAIRQAIRRLLESLAKTKDEQGKPHQVLRPFGEHLDRYLLKPSSRSGGGRNSRVRAGLAGRFTYEPPDGVKWRG